jgi:hypothetical protein
MRYRYDENTGRVLRFNEKTGKWVQDRTKPKGFDFSKPVNFVPDIAEFVANATDKPVLISSRSQLGRYERSNNIRQCGDFKRGEIAERRAKKVNRELAEAKRLGGGANFTWVDFRQ